MIEKYDVVIVGAGFAGLSAGLELKKNNKTFKIIEPRETVGGRVYNTLSKNKEIIELGGQWLGELHTTALNLVKKYNLKLYKTPRKYPENHIYIYKKEKLDHLPAALVKVLEQINALANEIDLNAPYNHPKAKEWDSITLETWLNQNLKDKSEIDMIGKQIAENFLSCSANETTFLQSLFYISSNSSIDYLANFKNGAQDFRVVGGMAKLAQLIAQELGNENLSLNEYVKEIRKEKNSNYLIIGSKQTYSAKHVIIATAPRKIIDIKIIPELPKEYLNFYSNYTNGKAYKFHFEYENDFWTNNAKSGYVFKQTSLITEIVDNSTPISKKFIYTGFIYGKNKDILYKENNTKEKRALALANEIRKIYGEEALKFNEFIEYDWFKQKFQDGCFVSRPKEKIWTTYGKIWQKPFEKIHFAGTETSSEFNGYIEGAIRSGIRVVKDILPIKK